jgi:hypothetical protein
LFYSLYIKYIKIYNSLLLKGNPHAAVTAAAPIRGCSLGTNGLNPSILAGCTMPEGGAPHAL